jgi:hypothetical protein
MSERNFFHRSSAQTVRAPRVVNDLAGTDVDAVMQIAPPRCDKVRTQRGFLVPDQEAAASELPAKTHGSVTAAYVHALTARSRPGRRLRARARCDR